MNNKTGITKNEIQAFQNVYVLRPGIYPAAMTLSQYHAGLWDRAEDPRMEEILWQDFIQCSLKAMEALGNCLSVITSLSVSGPHKASAMLEAWYDSPPLSGRLLPSNYGMDVCVLTRGVPSRELSEFYQAVTLGMNECHSVKVFREPFPQMLAQEDQQLLDLSITTPMLTMWLTHHPLLKIEHSSSLIAREQIIITIKEVLADLSRRLSDE